MPPPHFLAGLKRQLPAAATIAFMSHERGDKLNIPGRTEEPPLATWQMPPPSSAEPPPEPKRDDSWVGKAKKKAKRRR